jgi:hypothetical protein
MKVEKIIKEAERFNRMFYYLESIEKFQEAVKLQSKELASLKKRNEELKEETKIWIGRAYIKTTYNDINCEKIIELEEANNKLKEQVKKVGQESKNTFRKYETKKDREKELEDGLKELIKDSPYVYHVDIENLLNK